jgi:alpha-tubulin suppressor-like RCC1 family protein
LADDTAVVMSGDRTMSRLDGDQWTELAAAPNEPLRIRNPYGRSVHAVSAEEVWVASGQAWHRYRDDKWSELGPGTEGAVVASDGALWGWRPSSETHTGDLVRLTPDRSEVVSSEAMPWDSGPQPLRPDRNGSVWWVSEDGGDDGDVLEYRADATRASIGRPEGLDLLCLEGVGIDGSVWVSRGEDEGEGTECWVDDDWHRWDGRRWVPEQAPDKFVSNWLAVVAGDGTGWAFGGDEAGTGYAISRYADEATRTFVSAPMVSPHSLTVLAGGQACVVEVPVEMEGDTPTTDPSKPSGIACYDDDGQYATFALPEVRLQGVAIAPDGAVWVLGPQVVRLTEDLSEAQGSGSPVEPASPSAPVGTIQPSAAPFVGATALAAGGGHSCAIVADGRVACWGGINGVVMYGPRAVTVPTLTDITALAAGGAHSCAVVAGGRVTCWGYNYSGQLGDGTTENRSNPVAVNGVAGAVDVAAGSAHTCALVAGGGVQCWGLNEFGQLGDGTTTNRSSPVTVRGLTGATALSAGGYHTCALVSFGRIVCWGQNDYGQLADGTTTNRTSPVAVQGLTGVIAVAAGAYRTCAVTAERGVHCWGMDESSPGEVTNRVSPAVVQGVTGVTSLAAGGRHACAVVDGGQVRCWGSDNFEGQLGDGTTDYPWSPVAVEGLAGATALAAGDMHTCAILSSGGVECWGWNAEGQLGDGSEQGRLAPVTVSQ